MISPTPEDYGYVQIDRPVLDGEQFLSQVRTIGQRILGGESITSISEIALTEPEFDDEDPELIHQLVPTVDPIISVSQKNDFSMILLHRGAPRYLSSRFSFGHAQGRLAADHIMIHKKVEDDDGEVHRAKIRIPSLTNRLNEIVEKTGENPESHQVIFDRVDIIGETGRDSVLGLLPRNRGPQYLSIVRQGKACAERLMIVSKKLAAVVTPWVNGAPFARIPGNISDRDYDEFMTKMDELLPLRLTLGGVGYSSKDRRN